MPGLYIHIPFCKKKCGYCDFASFAYSEDLIPAYLSALEKEIDAVRNPIRSAPLSISTIYIGGGTPTLLSIEQLSGMIDIVRARFPRPNNLADIEFTIESNPGTINIEKLKALRDLGINRLSIGAQSFDDDELKLLGRIHDSSQLYEAYEAARKAGFKNINLDLIFALPGQTLESWKKTLKKAIEMKPEHISAYNLQIEEGTPFYNKYSRTGEAFSPLPDNDLEYEMFKETIDLLKSSGYHHYEISNFSKPGFECRHNINYWKNGDYLGIGLSAASHINGQRYENIKSLEEYIYDPVRAHCAAPRPIKEEISETMIMGLRLLEGIDLISFWKKYSKDISAIYKKEIDELLCQGLLEKNGGKLRLTDKGLFIANRVFEYFV